MSAPLLLSALAREEGSCPSSVQTWSGTNSTRELVHVPYVAELALAPVVSASAVVAQWATMPLAPMLLENQSQVRQQPGAGAATEGRGFMGPWDPCPGRATPPCCCCCCWSMEPTSADAAVNALDLAGRAPQAAVVAQGAVGAGTRPCGTPRAPALVTLRPGTGSAFRGTPGEGPGRRTGGGDARTTAGAGVSPYCASWSSAGAGGSAAGAGAGGPVLAVAIVPLSFRPLRGLFHRRVQQGQQTPQTAQEEQ